jgi:CRP-like cAMP-binding protein
MMISSLATPLEEHPLIKNLDDRFLKYISECASNVSFDEGAYLFRTGEEADRLYAIHQGRVAIELNVPGRKHLIIQTLGDGAVIGWSWLFPPYQWHFDGRVMAPTSAISFDAGYLREKCEEDHEFGYQFMKYFSHILFDRLMSARFQLINVYDLF